MKGCVALSALPILLLPTPAQTQQRIGTIEQWITSADYPSDALARREEGVVRVQYGITPQGTVTGCKVEFSNASSSLRTATCALIEQRARYLPAHNKSGNPIAGKDMLTVRWNLPPKDVIAGSADFGGSMPIGNPATWVTGNDYNGTVSGIGEGEVGLSFAIGSSGRIESCSITLSSGDSAVDQYSCALLQRRARFRQPLGDRGQPLATNGRTVIHWAPQTDRFR